MTVRAAAPRLFMVETQCRRARGNRKLTTYPTTGKPEAGSIQAALEDRVAEHLLQQYDEQTFRLVADKCRYPYTC
jgi:hypothetical protein